MNMRDFYDADLNSILRTTEQIKVSHDVVFVNTKLVILVKAW